MGHRGNQTHNTLGMVDLPDLGGPSQTATVIEHIDLNLSRFAPAPRPRGHEQTQIGPDRFSPGRFRSQNDSDPAPLLGRELPAPMNSRGVPVLDPRPRGPHARTAQALLDGPAGFVSRRRADEE